MSERIILNTLPESHPLRNAPLGDLRGPWNELNEFRAPLPTT